MCIGAEKGNDAEMEVAGEPHLPLGSDSCWTLLPAVFDLLFYLLQIGVRTALGVSCG